MNMTWTFRNPLYTNMSNFYSCSPGFYEVGIPKKIVLNHVEKKTKV